MFGSTKWRTAVFNVPDTVQDLMSVRTTTLTFTFLDPVQCLIRLLTAGPLSANEENMAFVPRLNGRWYVFIMMWAVIHERCHATYITLRYDDYEDGDRFKRVHAALPSGSFALMCTLFFDSILRDKKGLHGVLLCILVCLLLCPLLCHLLCHLLCLLLCPFVVSFVVSFVVYFVLGTVELQFQ